MNIEAIIKIFDDAVRCAIDDKKEPIEAIKIGIGAINEQCKDGDVAGHILAIAQYHKVDKSIINSELADIVKAQIQGTLQYQMEQKAGVIKNELLGLYTNLQKSNNYSDTINVLKSISNTTSKMSTLDDIKNGINRTPDLEELWNDTSDEDIDGIIFDTLAKIQLGKQTLSYIGGRPSRGKTSLLVTVGVEALTKGKSVLFVTLEETPKEILKRFILCYAYYTTTPEKRIELDKEPCTNAKYGGGTKEAYACLRKYNDKANVNPIFKDIIIKAKGDIIKSNNQGRLTILNGDGANFENLFELIKINAKDIILYDYIQISPAKTSKGLSDNLYKTADASAELRRLAKDVDAIIIGGAQFRRDEQKSKKDEQSKTEDNITMASFRGCGDIEQDANTAIGIVGSEIDADIHCMKILKQREGGGRTNIYNFDFNGAYSYMVTNGEQTNKETTKKQKTKKLSRAQLEKERVIDSLADEL